MPKVLVISPQPYFQWRGTPIRVGFDVLALQENGYDVDLLTLPIGDDKHIAGVNVIRVANILGLENISIGPSPAKLVFDVLIFFKAIRLAFKHRYTVYHGIEEAGFMAMLLAKCFGGKSVFEKHSDPWAYRKNFLRNALLWAYSQVERLSVNFANAVICTGPGLKKQAEQLGAKCPVYSISDIPSSLVEAEAGRVAHLQSELRQHEDAVLVTFVGSFAIYQGVELMFEMIPEVCLAHPHIQFIIIGGSPEEIAQRQQSLAQQGVAAHSVNFLQRMPPDVVPDYLAAADIVISPRVAGINTPLKILDYFKAKTAIVATDIPSNRQILDDTTAALSVPNASAFGEAIIALANDPEKRQLLAQNGHQKYLDEYNFATFKSRIAEVYDTALTSN